MAYRIVDGYVHYIRGAESNSPYWRMVNESGIEEAQNIENLYSGELDNYVQAGERLISLGKQERAKEIALINEATGNKFSSDEEIKEFIKKFNEVLIGSKQFQAAIDRLKHALSKETQGKNYRAPTAASWFTSKLNTTLSRNINNFIKRNEQDLINKDFSAWEREFDNIIDKSIEQAFKEMLTKIEKTSKKELYGNKDTWGEVFQASRTIQGFDKYFIELIRNRIDFNKIKKIFKDNQIKLKNKKQTGVNKYIKNTLGFEGKNSRSIAGNVQEVIMNVMEELGEAAQSATSHGHIVFKSGMMSTDNVSLYSYSAEINTEQQVQNLLNELNQTMDMNESLIDAANVMKQFYDNHLSKLDKSFIVYGSTKSYALTESFTHGFSKGGEQPLEHIIPYLEQAKLGDKDKVNKFIKAAYNTANGAILSDKRMFFTEQLKAAIMSSIAELLFDDWITIGEVNKGAQSIHVLQLEGLEIPLSVLLIATGEAMKNTAQDMNKLVKVNIKLPEKIIYDKPIVVPSELEGREIGKFMLEKWNEQRETAQREATFNVHFLVNFKTIIRKWIK